MNNTKKDGSDSTGHPFAVLVDKKLQRLYLLWSQAGNIGYI